MKIFFPLQTTIVKGSPVSIFWNGHVIGQNPTNRINFALFHKFVTRGNDEKSLQTLRIRTSLMVTTDEWALRVNKEILKQKSATIWGKIRFVMYPPDPTFNPPPPSNFPPRLAKQSKFVFQTKIQNSVVRWVKMSMEIWQRCVFWQRLTEMCIFGSGGGETGFWPQHSNGVAVANAGTPVSWWHWGRATMYVRCWSEPSTPCHYYSITPKTSERRAENTSSEHGYLLST